MCILIYQGFLRPSLQVCRIAASRFLCNINLPIVVAGHNKNTYEKDIVFNNPSFGDYDFAIIIV